MDGRIPLGFTFAYTLPAMSKPMDRRRFLSHSFGAAAGLGLAHLSCGPKGPREAEPSSPSGDTVTESLFEISLAEWSLHRSIFGESLLEQGLETLLRSDEPTAFTGEIEHLDFARTARGEFGIAAVEYVNTFFFDKARDQGYLNEMKRRADGEGVRSLLIMCDSEGALGDPDTAARRTAVENHHKWVEAAKFLGCHSIRVNARSDGSPEEQQKLAADGLRQLAEFADGHGLNVLVENHGGLSSDGRWLVGVMELVDHPRIGTLPDFGNFRIGDDEWYDFYQGVSELMPFAKAVSAKSHDFDDEGNETQLDYERLVGIVLDAGYRGHLGIEYEGTRLTELEGIRATQKLLERVRDRLGATRS